MQTSRDIAASLLHGYAFVEHVFAYDSSTVADIQRSLAVYASYDMRIVRMCLPKEWNEPLVDADSGQPLLPRSIVALTLGARYHVEEAPSAAYTAFDAESAVKVDKDSWEANEFECRALQVEGRGNMDWSARR